MPSNGERASSWRNYRSRKLPLRYRAARLTLQGRTTLHSGRLANNAAAGEGSPKRGRLTLKSVTSSCCMPNRVVSPPTDLASFEAKPIGTVESTLPNLDSAPRQAGEGAPEAWLVFELERPDGLRCLQPGDAIIVLTWLERARPDVLSVPGGGTIRGRPGEASAPALLIAPTPYDSTHSHFP